MLSYNQHQQLRQVVCSLPAVTLSQDAANAGRLPYLPIHHTTVECMQLCTWARGIEYDRIGYVGVQASL